MSQRRSPIVLLATAALGLAVLTGCTPTIPVATATTPAPTGTTVATTAPTTPPTTQPVATTTPPATTTTAKGCAPTTAIEPADAVDKTTIDVDGDGLKDTEWVSDTPSLKFGVTTASGATYSYSLSAASPAPREGFIARLNDHRIVSMVDDNRAAYVHFFVNCGWVTPKNAQGQQYTFDYNEFTGHGSGVGCSLGYVVGWQLKNTSTGYTVTKTPMNLNVTGSYATNGTTSTVVSNASVNDPRVKTAQTISCAGVTVANGGVSVG